jgi:hypothetical protein
MFVLTGYFFLDGALFSRGASYYFTTDHSLPQSRIALARCSLRETKNFQLASRATPKPRNPTKSRTFPAAISRPQLFKMAPSSALKTTFKATKTIKPFYSGGVGCVALDRSGRLLVTANGDEAVITDIENGAEVARIDGVCGPLEFRILASLTAITARR